MANSFFLKLEILAYLWNRSNPPPPPKYITTNSIDNYVQYDPHYQQFIFSLANELSLLRHSWFFENKISYLLLTHLREKQVCYRNFIINFKQKEGLGWCEGKTGWYKKFLNTPLHLVFHVKHVSYRNGRFTFESRT